MQKMETINDHVHLAKEKSKTDAEFYKIQKQAEANKLLLSKEYLELKKVEAMATNNKVRILFTMVPLYNHLLPLGLLWARYSEHVHQRRQGHTKVKLNGIKVGFNHHSLQVNFAV